MVGGRYAHLVMDTRGQGSAWSPGDTAGPRGRPATGQYPGFTTRGIDDPRTAYWRRLITDAVLAVDAAIGHPAWTRAGSSSPGRARAAASRSRSPDCRTASEPPRSTCRSCATGVAPWTSRTRIPTTRSPGYLATRRDLAERVFANLAYFDGVNFATRAQAPGALLGRADGRDLPAIDRVRGVQPLRGPREISIWPFNGHDAGELHQVDARFAFLERLGLAP